ncbi:MAG: hypothetical protein CL569_07970 [Alphaproteobacteria bacterium]|nr:hypothetical protein [Alphaproteobacteria bacterium]
MRIVILVIFALFAAVAPAQAGESLVVKTSPYSVKKTIDRLEAIFNKKGITVFARVDHAAGAAKVGKSRPPTELIIFGNPKLGTPLMKSSRKIGIALPLKVLAWREGGKVKLAYTKPSRLAQRYSVVDRDPVIKKITGALNNLTNAAIKK